MLNRRGVTLMELVIVIAITGVLASFMAFFAIEAVRTWNSLRFRSEALAQARVAVEQMVRDLRQVNNETSVHTATGERFNFTDAAGTIVDYARSGSSLTRNGVIAAEGITQLSFIYFSATNQVIASPAVAPSATDIHRINVTIGVQSGSEEKRVSCEVSPRNL